MNLPECAGIYVLTNRHNQKHYVGQSINIKRRVTQHLGALRSGKHCNVYLQNSWDKYGEDCFDVNVVELCNEDELNDKEIFYINSFNSYRNGYNLTIGGEGHRGYVMTDAQKEIYRQIQAELNGTRVVLLNTGEVFKSIGEAERKYHIDRSSVSLCCQGIRYHSGVLNGQNLAWAYYDDYIKLSQDDIDEMIYKAQYMNKGALSTSSKKVVLLNTGEIFDCLRDAMNHYSVHDSAISGCCLHKRKSAGTHNGELLVWRHYDEYVLMSDDEVIKQISDANRSNKGENHCNAKRVKLLNTGEVFGSLSDAARYYNLTLKGISQCCTGAKKSSGRLNGVKMVWQYA